MNFINLNNIRLLRWTNLYYFRMENDYGLSAIKILVRNQQDTYNELQKKMQTEMRNDESLKSDSEYSGAWYQHRYEAEEMTLSKLLIIQRYSVVNTYYSYFEGQLQHLCNELSQEFNMPIRRKMKGDSDLNRYYKFLSNDFGMNMNDVEQYYDLINEQKIVRNLITHHQGYIQNWSSITEVPGLLIQDNGVTKRIHIESTYYDYLHNNINGFLTNIVLPLDLRYEQLRT